MENNYPKNYGYYKKSLWKWILLYALIGAAAYGLIYYFFFYNKGGYIPQNYQNQTQNSIQDNFEIKNWQTYRNADYGFEIQYPDKTHIGSITDIPRGKSITLQLDSADKTLNIKILSQNPHCPDTVSGADYPDVSINGINFTKIDVSRELSGAYPPYAVASEYCAVVNNIEYKLILSIHYTRGENDVNFILPKVDADPVLNQMLSTFKFTD